MGVPVSKFNLTNPPSPSAPIHLIICSSDRTDLIAPCSTKHPFQPIGRQLKYIDESSSSTSDDSNGTRTNSSASSGSETDDNLCKESFRTEHVSKRSIAHGDNDSGNASISDDVDRNSGCCEDSESFEHNDAIATDDKNSSAPLTLCTMDIGPKSLNRFCSMNGLLFNGYHQKHRRYSSSGESFPDVQSRASMFIQSNSMESMKMLMNLKKTLLNKATGGDLIEIRCVCRCHSKLIDQFMRASIRNLSGTISNNHNHRQRFRRSLQYGHKTNYQQMMAWSSDPSHHYSTMPSRRHRSRFFFRSSIDPSIPPTNTVPSSPSSFKSSLSQLLFGKSSCFMRSAGRKHNVNDHILLRSQSSYLTHPSDGPEIIGLRSDQYCSEQFHYVYVDRVEPGEHSAQIMCYHVKPFDGCGEKWALKGTFPSESSSSIGIIRYESLDVLIGQLLFETEERHWQSVGYAKPKPPKIFIQCQLRNQEKFSRRILKQTLNTKPRVERMREILHGHRDCYVRYNGQLLNSEHYATLWKYGIGWSTWANHRADITRTLHKFVERFSRLVATDYSSKPNEQTIQLQGGECLSLENSSQVNLIVQCFGLAHNKLEQAIQQWLQWQVFIANNKNHHHHAHIEHITTDHDQNQQMIKHIDEDKQNKETNEIMVKHKQDESMAITENNQHDHRKHIDQDSVNQTNQDEDEQVIKYGNNFHDKNQ